MLLSKEKKDAEVAMTEAQDNLKTAQGRQKVEADKRRTEEPNLEVGTEVLLSTKNIQWKHP